MSVVVPIHKYHPVKNINLWQWCYHLIHMLCISLIFIGDINFLTNYMDLTNLSQLAIWICALSNLIVMTFLLSVDIYIIHKQCKTYDEYNSNSVCSELCGDYNLVFFASVMTIYEVVFMRLTYSDVIELSFCLFVVIHGTFIMVFIFMNIIHIVKFILKIVICGLFLILCLILSIFKWCNRP